MPERPSPFRRDAAGRGADPADPPSHPQTPASPIGSADRQPRPKRAWPTYLLVIAGVAAVLLMVVLHLAGVVGPSSH
jgi:hypothetical protein